MVFGTVAAATFAGLGIGCYALYGQPFLQEAYLYHGSRRDPRHNFAPYFYPAYLELGAEYPSDALPRFGKAISPRFCMENPVPQWLQEPWSGLNSGLEIGTSRVLRVHSCNI